MSHPSSPSLVQSPLPLILVSLAHFSPLCPSPYAHHHAFCPVRLSSLFLSCFLLDNVFYILSLPWTPSFLLPPPVSTTMAPSLDSFLRFSCVVCIWIGQLPSSYFQDFSEGEVIESMKRRSLMLLVALWGLEIGRIQPRAEQDFLCNCSS